ncbi:MAG: type II toxin-antitoxin system Phd/YefM family antitoxin [Pseudomonadota bacterium]
MKRRDKKKNPEIVYREGKPRAVILDIEDYQEMLERLEDLDDLKMLQQIRKESMSFKKLEEFLKEYSLSPLIP